MGGGVTSALDLATGLAGAGHEVTVVCHPDSGIHRHIRKDPRIRWFVAGTAGPITLVEDIVRYLEGRPDG